MIQLIHCFNKPFCSSEDFKKTVELGKKLGTLHLKVTGKVEAPFESKCGVLKTILFAAFQSIRGQHSLQVVWYAHHCC